MAYCVICGVKLEEGSKRCPLCNTEVHLPQEVKQEVKAQTTACAQAVGLLPAAGCNRKEQFVHVRQPVAVAKIAAAHLPVLLPAFRAVRLQEVVAAHAQATATPHLQEARVLTLLRPEVAAVAVAVQSAVVAAAAAVAQVAVAVVAQVDADKKETYNYSIRACICTCALIYLRY